MNVRQLIRALEKIEDKEKEVEIGIRVHKSPYPVAYTPIFGSWAGDDNAYFGGVDGVIRIYTFLPHDNETYMMTQIRKIGH
jgi:hypothetical protein